MNIKDSLLDNMAAKIEAQSATIAELREENENLRRQMAQWKLLIDNQSATIADRNELIAHLQERLDA